MKKPTELVILTGANSSLSLPFISYFNQKNTTKIIALFKNNPIEAKWNIIPLQCDLVVSEDIKHKLQEIFSSDLMSDIKKVYLMHMMWSFKYEGISQIPEKDDDKDGIDDDIFESNVTAFENVLNALQSSYTVDDNHQLILFNVWSKRDYNPDGVPWKSYALAKNILRDKFKKLSDSNKNIQGLFINAGTIDIDKERILRPFGEYTFRLKPQEIFEWSIYELEHIEWYKELELYKFHPKYETHFREETLMDTHERWLKEMGIVNK
jgi:hypothetical protein